MKNEFDFDSIEHEKKDYFLVEKKSIETITDINLLGLYIYIEMLIDDNIINPIDVIDKVCSKFSMNSDQAMKYINELINMGILKMKK